MGEVGEMLDAQESKVTARLSWAGVFSSLRYSEPNVIWTINKGYLRYDDHYFRISALDAELLWLVSIIGRRSGHLGILYPTSHFKAFPLLALEILRSRKSKDIKSRPHVLCLSTDLAHRHEFKHLCNPRGPVHLVFYPIGIVRVDGKIRRDSPHVSDSVPDPQLIFCPSRKIIHMDEAGASAYAVLISIDEIEDEAEMRSVLTWIKKMNIQISIYISVNPLSKNLATLKEAGVPIWGWDISSLRKISAIDGKDDSEMPFSPSFQWLENLKNRKYIVVPVDESSASGKLKEARDRSRRLLREAEKQTNPLLMDAIRKLWSTIRLLEGLPCPTSYYNDASRLNWGTISVASRIGSAYRLAERIEGVDPSWASFYRSTLDILSMSCELSKDDYSGKPSVILDIIDQAAVRGSGLAILARNQAAKRSLENFLRSKGKNPVMLNGRSIYICTDRDLDMIPNVKTLLFTQTPDQYSRYLLSFPGSTNIGIMAYPQEKNEIVSILRELSLKLDALDLQNQLQTISILSGKKLKELESRIDDKSTEESMADRISVIESAHSEVDDIVIDGVLDEIFSLDGISREAHEMEIDSEEDDIEAIENGEPEDVIRFHFEGVRIINVRPSKMITLLDMNHNSLHNRRAEEVVEGDLVVIVNETVSRGLTHTLLEKIDKHPRMRDKVVLQRLWVRNLREGMEKNNDTPESLLRKIRAIGSSIGTPMAVQFWRSGSVIGPSDKNDIARIGRVYGFNCLIDNLNEIYEAIERIRSIHRRLAHRIRFLCKSAGVTCATSYEEDYVIDDELNLHLEDFADSVTIERVTFIERSYFQGPIEFNRIRTQGDLA